MYYEQLRKDIGDQTLDGYNNVLDRIAESYRDYAEAATMDAASFPGSPEELIAEQNSYREAFRIACNDLDYRPYDIVRILNGHTCGDPGEYPFRCDLGEGKQTGECLYGIKQRAYLLDKFRLGSQDTLASIQDFGLWMISALLQAQFLQAVCLPPDRYACPSEFDLVRMDNMKNTERAIANTLEILQAVGDNCICPCKNLVAEQVKVGTNTELGREELRFWLGARTSGGDERFTNIYENDNADTPRTFKDINKYLGDPGKTVVTQDDTLIFKTIEYDSSSGDDRYTAESNFAGLADDGVAWYDKTCSPYIRTFTYDTDGTDQDKWTIRVEGVMESECPTGYCSADTSRTCNNDQFCDSANYKCQDKLETGSCDNNNAVSLTGNCTAAGTCEPPKANNSTCASNLECESKYCFDDKCCPPNSACETCSTDADCLTFSAGDCAECSMDGYCVFECDAFCGPRCEEAACENPNCAP